MQTNYIYSTNRLTTVATTLLSAAEVDQLLGATTDAELLDVIKETYLGQHLNTGQDDDINVALEAALAEAKRTIELSAPGLNTFQLLWIGNDIHNLRVFAKASTKEIPYSDLESLVSKRGHYDPTVLFAYLERSELNRLQPNWQDVYEQAARHAADGEIDKVDAIFDQLYFNTVVRLVSLGRDVFLTKYVRALIDCYNLKTKLRVLRYPSLVNTTTFVSGGTFAATELESLDQVKQALATLGNVDWEAALTNYDETGNTTAFDVCVDQYLLALSKQASYDVFSSASVVHFYLLANAAASDIRTIWNGKGIGRDETIIRANLRIAYE